MANTIPESFVVEVNISRVDQPAGVESFGIVLFAGDSDVIGQTERVRQYDSLESVLDDFGSTAEEFKAAETFFSQSPRPSFMKIARILTADLPGFLEGLVITGSLASFQAVLDGEFSVSIDGDQQDILALDFSSDTSFNDVASTIEAGIQAIGTGGYTAATVLYDSFSGKFTITSGTTGDLSTLSFLSAVSGGGGTDISGAAFLNMLSGKLIPGVTAGATIVDEIGKIQEVDNNWYWLTLHKGIRDDADVLLVAAYIAGLKKIYLTNSNDPTAVDGQISSDTLSLLKATNNFRVGAGLQLADVNQYLDIALAAKAAAVDFNAADSTITLANKTLNNLTVDNFNSNVVSIVAGSRNNSDDKHGNVFVSIGSRNVVQQGKVSNGEFIDIIHGTDWLEQRIQQNVFNLLIDTPTKIPFTDAGITLVVSQVASALQQGINNGLLSNDVNNFPGGQAYLIEYPRVIDIPATDRAARRLTGIKFSAKYEGAIHFTTINGTITV